MITMIVGTSGSGKTTFANNHFGVENALVSVTTRPKREGELEGVDYYFISEDEYFQLQRNNSLGEQTYYAGNYYGITVIEIKEKARLPQSFAIVDVTGYQQLKTVCNTLGVDYQVVYLVIDKKEVKNRLVKRGDHALDIEKRLEQYDVDEQNNRVLYEDPRCIVINANQDEAGIIQQFNAATKNTTVGRTVKKGGR